MELGNTDGIREAGWWDDCVRALHREPLAEVAARFGVDAVALRGALVAAGAGGPAELAPWWPEALRLRATQSLRAIARTFGTDPRRLRRGLARLHLRVAGQDLEPGQGAAALAPFAEALGREPDGAIARRAGVIPEAVQGERRRLGAPAHVQRRRVRFSREEEAWIRGPQRGRRARVQVDDALQVVRRPARADEHAHRPSGWGVGHADPRRRDEPERRPIWPERGPMRSEAAEELERLLQPVRQRDGRTRIVRSEPPRTAPAPTAEVRLEPAPRRRMSEAPAAPLAPSVPEAPPVVAVRRRVARPVDPPAAPVESRAASEAEGAEWLVAVPGSSTPLRVRAPDLLGAIAAAGQIVSADTLRRASVWRADETS